MNAIEAELNALPDAAFIDGQGIDQILGAGQVFRFRGQFLMVLGFAERLVWDDAKDGWTRKRLPGCRPATAQEIEAAGLVEAAPVEPRPFAVRAFADKGSFAIAGKSGGHAVGSRKSASRWATREEAEAAIPAIVAGSPAFFRSPVVVELTD